MHREMNRTIHEVSGHAMLGGAITSFIATFLTGLYKLLETQTFIVTAIAVSLMGGS